MLSNLVLPTKKLRHRGEDIVLHGLSFNDITSILIDRRAEVLAAWEEFEKRTSDGQDIEQYQGFALHMLQVFPSLVAQVIATAAHEPAAVEQAAALPGPVSLEALLAVAQLTFEDVGAVQNFLSNLATMFEGLNKVAKMSLTQQPTARDVGVRLTGTHD